MKVDLYNDDCLNVLKTFSDNSIDSVVTDPPYGLAFMGKKWDYDVPSEEIWRECLRVLKPGGHLLAFAGTRTQHRMAVRIEDAGFEIRDMIAWVYGSGFPKSLNVSKAIDKAAGVRGHDGTRFNAVGQQGERTTGGDKFRSDHPDYVKPEAITDAAHQWQGWGTALKPALEPITMARKPLIGTAAKNVLAHGTGALNIDGCRVGTDDGENRARPSRTPNTIFNGGKGTNLTASEHNVIGRWPANLIHDGSEEVLKFAGDAARFFYCAKASKKDRDEGNNHPTVKPTDLMRYLCRLVTPPNGTVLDPFMGSGSTGKAAKLDGFNFVGIEMNEEYFKIAEARIK